MSRRWALVILAVVSLAIVVSAVMTACESGSASRSMSDSEVVRVESTFGVDGRATDAQFDELWIISRDGIEPDPDLNNDRFDLAGGNTEAFIGASQANARSDGSVRRQRGTSDGPEVAFQRAELSRSARLGAAPLDGRESPDRLPVPGAGGLITQGRDGTGFVHVPLDHTEVDANINGHVASVNVRQRFQNPYDTKIEAIYVFPLPADAAVNGFLMTIGDRRIRGIIREREEAERIYNAARAQGHVASLLSQQRPNIFTQKVANIEPGKRIDIDITYFHTLSYSDGWFEWVFPMVVGPRFNPVGAPDPVLANPRGQMAPQGATGVTYMRPEERSGHDIGVTIKIEAGVPIEELICRSHVVEVSRYSETNATVALSPLDAIPNKDFVLRFRVAGDQVRSGFVTQRTDAGGYFSFMLIPPLDLAATQRGPMEMIFVLDCSGSMNGEPIRQAKSAVERVLKQLRPEDSFQIIRFSNNALALGTAPLEANQNNVRRGLKYLDSLNGSGGTMMIEGIKAALDFPHDPRRLRFVCFLTDGFIGNEAEILSAMAPRLKDSRVFSVGIGSSPNRHLIARMAEIGRGVAAYVGPQDDAAQIMDQFFLRVSHASMTDVQLEFDGAADVEYFPSRSFDLFVGRPIMVTGRFEGESPQRIVARGTIAGEERIVTAFATDATNRTALGPIWARTKITSLSNQALETRDGDFKNEIRNLALEHGLVSAYTSFIAVDSLSRTEGDHGVTVTVPVPTPQGVRYDTTVGK